MEPVNRTSGAKTVHSAELQTSIQKVTMSYAAETHFTNSFYKVGVVPNRKHLVDGHIGLASSPALWVVLISTNYTWININIASIDP